MNILKQFIEKYAAAASKPDISALSEHYHSLFTLSTSTSLWQIKNGDTFRTNLHKAFEGYETLGYKSCKLLASKITEFTSNHVMIDIEWGLLDKDQTLLVQFDVSYFAKLIDGDWQFIFVIDHNENERIAEYKAQKEPHAQF